MRTTRLSDSPGRKPTGCAVRFSCRIGSAVGGIGGAPPAHLPHGNGVHPQELASPTGEISNRLVTWLRGFDALRQALGAARVYFGERVASFLDETIGQSAKARAAN